MRVLALDISTKTGWALLDGPVFSQDYLMPNIPKLVDRGRVTLGTTVRGFGNRGYPWDFVGAVETMAKQVAVVVSLQKPDVVVIEETNGSRSRYTQKILEWLHLEILRALRVYGKEVFYVNTSDWRRLVGATLTKEDKKLNAKVRKLKRIGDREGLKALGVRGRIGKKHVAIRYVNGTYGLKLKMKDNDVADAICLGISFFLGARPCDGN